MAERIFAPLPTTPHTLLDELRWTTSIVLSTVTSVVGSSTTTVCESAAACRQLRSSADEVGFVRPDAQRGRGLPDGDWPEAGVSGRGCCCWAEARKLDSNANADAAFTTCRLSRSMRASRNGTSHMTRRLRST